eukprot:2833070-Rhodomonas_salina.1
MAGEVGLSRPLRLSPLAANRAYKYLGVRMTVHSDTWAEVAHVQTRTQAISKLMKGHQYTSKQAKSGDPLQHLGRCVTAPGRGLCR